MERRRKIKFLKGFLFTSSDSFSFFIGLLVIGGVSFCLTSFFSVETGSEVSFFSASLYVFFFPSFLSEDLICFFSGCEDVTEGGILFSFSSSSFLGSSFFTLSTVVSFAISSSTSFEKTGGRLSAFRSDFPVFMFPENIYSSFSL